MRKKESKRRELKRGKKRRRVKRARRRRRRSAAEWSARWCTSIPSTNLSSFSTAFHFLPDFPFGRSSSSLLHTAFKDAMAAASAASAAAVAPMHRSRKSATLPLWPVESRGLSAFSIRHHPTTLSPPLPPPLPSSSDFSPYSIPRYPSIVIPLFIFTVSSVMHARRYTHACSIPAHVLFTISRFL